ncbi:ABC transporter related protein [Thermobaculum terrenum ATCC BAA-798]|uniref:ABC transporter related protein n=1 Tax=Thermobaculum terrenum (strain ATCC BAA-798 / CCMEE 7001 / YNP1) TaxID=525904 RepID=D1CE44_THET1|nr:ABC transporter ATP-binding protein [Thermobaculum terrenum]ACZ41200.1 ABC transporter related protein [Thermobaculum terrenum ATCC BAA-798]
MRPESSSQTHPDSWLLDKDGFKQPAIQVVDVVRKYKVGSEEVQALRGINLTVPEGQFVALMGRSGSGKTTLLNIIGGLDRPTTGEVFISGQSLSNLSEGELTKLRRSQFGFVFQSFALIPILSAAENVELPLRIAGKYSLRERKQRVMEALSLVGLAKWAEHRPYEMSGGQQQRVAIARALVTRPKILIADEPTGELDSKTGQMVLNLLRKVVDESKVTLVMATHDPAVEEYADVLYRMQDGQIIDTLIKTM